MIFRYKCGHTQRGPLWKDGLVVPMRGVCPACSKQAQPTYRTIVKGSKKLILKLIVKG
jgi:hypothetical protein